MKNFESESREGVPVTTRVLTSSELIDRIYQGTSQVQDVRFLPKDGGGVFKYFFVSEMDSPLVQTTKLYPVVEEQGLIVGLAELEEDPREEKNLWLNFVSVDSQYQGRGYSRKLLEQVFAFAGEEGCSLKVSQYSEEGEERLKKIIEELAETYDVRLTS